MYAPLTMTDDSMESRFTMLRLINGFQGSQAIHTLVQMSIPDLLADGTLLRSDHRQSPVGWAALIGRPAMWGNWGPAQRQHSLGRGPYSVIEALPVP
jgi:hypothetical protein